MLATRRLTRSSKKEPAAACDDYKSSSVAKKTSKLEDTGQAARDINHSSSKPITSRKKRSSKSESDNDSSQKKKKKSKDKRRSTIGRGRKSLVFTDGKALLTPEPKGEHSNAANVADEKEFVIADKSVQQDENLEKLQGKAVDTLDVITDKMEEQEQLLDVVYHLAERLPNKQNIYMSHAVTEYTNYIDILKEESQKWDDLLMMHKELTQQVAEKVKAVKGLMITEKPKSLTQDQKWVLDSKPDYVKMMQQLKLNREKLSLQILQVNRVVNLLAQLQNRANEKILDSFREYYDTAFKDIRSVDSRQLIMKLCNGCTSSSSSGSAN